MLARSPQCAPTISPRIRSPFCEAVFRQAIGKRLTTSFFGCVNQAGEDNRNVARMALLLAGLPQSVSGATVNRLCGSGMEAVATAARAIAAGEISLAIAGGVESMSRSPLVMPKATAAFSRHAEIHDTTLGWRFANPLMEKMYGIASMGETAENVAAAYKIDRASQDSFALRSQQKATAAQKTGIFAEEIAPVSIPGPKGSTKVVAEDEHLRADTSLEALAKLSTPFRAGGTVTAGNSSGINDGAAAMFVASEEAASRFGLTPLARVVGAATAGVEPNLMGIGPIPAMQKLFQRTKAHDERCKYSRTQRSVRRASPRRHSRVRSS